MARASGWRRSGLWGLERRWGSARWGQRLVRCLPGSLRFPPCQVTFHQSSLESSTSMIRSPGLGGESGGSIWGRVGLPSLHPHSPGPQVPCVPPSAEGGFLMPSTGGHCVTAGTAGVRQDRAGAGAGAMPSAPIPSWTRGSSAPLWAQQPQVCRRRFLKGPLTLLSQGLGVQSPEVGARWPPGGAGHKDDLL